jgi:hypothetical protein
MLSAALLGLIGGIAYTLIILNPGLRFSKLDITPKDLMLALLFNGFLGAVAGFLGWCFTGGQVGPPRSYGLFLLSGVGGGSLIQSWAFTLSNIQSKATLDRALETIERLAGAEQGTEGTRIASLSRSLRAESDGRRREELAREMAELAGKIGPRSTH